MNFSNFMFTFAKSSTNFARFALQHQNKSESLRWLNLGNSIPKEHMKNVNRMCCKN